MKLVTNSQHSVPLRVPAFFDGHDTKPKKVVHGLGGVNVRVGTVVFKRPIELEFIE